MTTVRSFPSKPEDVSDAALVQLEGVLKKELGPVPHLVRPTGSHNFALVSAFVG